MKPLQAEWQVRGILRATAHELFERADAAHARAYTYHTEGENDLSVDEEALYAEGDIYHARGAQLVAEGNLGWVTAIKQRYGNVVVTWRGDETCTVEGETYETPQGETYEAAV